MSLLLIVLLPFLGALLPMLMIRSGRGACAIASGWATTLSLALLFTSIPSVIRQEPVRFDWLWVPQLGLNIQFYLDGLGVLFAAMILVIGLLVIVYARFYLTEMASMGNFYTYLLIFQGAMLGVVLSNNILLMWVFWEITSLSSFLLIGFWGHTTEGRHGARMALTVTGLGGLAMIAGGLLIGKIVGSYEITDILASGNLIRESPYYPAILALVLIGCFTKSAQFPFHFWLPHAMAAPTPVSAYLHSATMVKAGIFLMARLWPVLSGTDLWFYTVATTGLITMLVGGWLAMFKDDLKSLLAYSTISHLGLMTMLLGFSTPMAVVACVLHIVNHATFKAALFMNAGIVDHEAGTRQIPKLGGLIHLMPATAIMGILAAASMGGLPPLNGFLSKEMMLYETAKTPWLGNLYVLPILVTLAAVCSFAYSLRYAITVFLGPKPKHYRPVPHDPDFGLWIAPTILVALVVAIGLFPQTLAAPLVDLASTAVMQQPAPEFHLSLWHGMNAAVTMSIIAIVGGSIVFFWLGPVRRTWDAMAVGEFKAFFDRKVFKLRFYSRLVTERLHNGSLPRSLSLMFTTALVVAMVGFASHSYGPGDRLLTPIPPLAVVPWMIALATCLLVVARLADRLISLVFVSVLGLLTSTVFIYFSAPDLALTQVSVEVVTLILMLLALHFLPKRSTVEQPRLAKVRNGVLAVAVGGAVSCLSWAVMTRNVTSISDYYWEQAIPGSGGKNVVNVILVDFRGFDTFGEIMVLGIAALIIYSVLDGLLSGPISVKLRAWNSGAVYSPNRHPLLLVVVTRLMLPLTLMVAAYIFLRGHNMPGGGFVAALIVSIALIMQYMASGFVWANKQVRTDYHALIGGGGLIAAATGIAAMVFDLPFLTSGYEHFHLPIIHDFELSSAISFDLGVFLTVVGAVMLALEQLSHLGEWTSRENEEPTEYNPMVPLVRRVKAKRQRED